MILQFNRANPDLFPTEKAQEKERQRLFKIIEELVQWENTTNERVLQAARDEIWQSWRRACADNADHPRAKELFNRHKLPAFHDPFAGGGALPLEAQRLGLEAYASDLNPVAVLINKAMIEIPPKFAGKPPVNPQSQRQAKQMGKVWHGAQGLAEDVRYYGQWMHDEAEKRIGHLYPKVEITNEMAKERPDLKPYVAKQLTVIAWLWARTVKSPNPAFSTIEVPLVTTFMLANKKGKEAYVDVVSDGNSYSFVVWAGKPANVELAKTGTKIARGSFRCVMSNQPITGDYIKSEAKASRMKVKLMAIVAEGDRGRVYLSPTPTCQDEAVAKGAKPNWRPEIEISGTSQYVGVKPYGIVSFSELFTDRQTAAMDVLYELLSEVRAKVTTDAPSGGEQRDSGFVYCDAVAVYLAMFLSRMVNLNNALCQWRNDPAKEHVGHMFARQAIPLVWDFAEANPFGESAGDLTSNYERHGDISLVIPSWYILGRDDHHPTNLPCRGFRSFLLKVPNGADSTGTAS